LRKNSILSLRLGGAALSAAITGLFSVAALAAGVKMQDTKEFFRSLFNRADCDGQ
jgi:hypothetical protein